MYRNMYKEIAAITTDQITKLTPIQATTLALAEPNLRVSKVVISVASMKGTPKANTGRPCFSQICLTFVSIFVRSTFLFFFALRLVSHSDGEPIEEDIEFTEFGHEFYNKFKFE